MYFNNNITLRPMYMRLKVFIKKTMIIFCGIEI